MSPFDGFDVPTQNWSKLPHSLIACLPMFAKRPCALAVLIYILRHTWGYQEFGVYKHITIDEIQHGRKDQNGDRLDNGVGYSRPAIREALQWLEAEGFLDVEIDSQDKARIKKYYRLHMKVEGNSVTPGGNSVTPEGNSVTPRGKLSYPRTEKDTLERNNTLSNDKAAKPPSLQQYFEDTVHRLHHCENGKKVIAIAKGFCDYCFGIDAPYGRVGRLIKQAGGAARFCQLCLEVLAKSPRGDPLSYITALLRNKKLETPRASPQTPPRTGPRKPNWELLRGKVYDFEYAKNWIMTHYPPERWATFVEGIARGEDADPSTPAWREYFARRKREKEQAHV